MQKHSDAPFATSSTFTFTQPDWIEFYLPVTALGLLGTFIILANSFVIGFYKAKWREAIPLMYIMIAVCDSVTGLMAICHAGMFAHYPVFRVLANGSVQSNFKADTFLVIVYIILQSCTRTSLLYNTVLAVVRTINITKPFLQIKRSIIFSLKHHPTTTQSPCSVKDRSRMLPPSSGTAFLTVSEPAPALRVSRRG